MMNLGQLIKVLDKMPQNVNVYFKDSPTHPHYLHSYRGFYEDLAIESVSNGEITVSAFRGMLKGAVGSIYSGYKGGHFKMNKNSIVWISCYGQCGSNKNGMVGDCQIEKVIFNKKMNCVQLKIKFAHW